MISIATSETHRLRAEQERAMADRALNAHAQRAHRNLAAMHERAAYRAWA